LEAETETIAEKSWSSEDATSLYMIDRWGSGYFGVNDAAIIAASFRSR
jgi:arginine decarboxylase-like protein